MAMVPILEWLLKEVLFFKCLKYLLKYLLKIQFRADMDMCSETDSTNECSDFKSELEEDEHGNGSGAGGRNASGQLANLGGSGGGSSGCPAGPGGPSVPRKSSGLSSKRTGRHPRVVFV